MNLRTKPPTQVIEVLVSWARQKLPLLVAQTVMEGMLCSSRQGLLLMVGQRDWSNSLCDWVLSKTLNCLIREGELLLMVGQRGIEASLVQSVCVWKMEYTQRGSG